MQAPFVIVILFLPALLFARACGPDGLAVPPVTAQAAIKNTAGEVVGNATFTELEDGAGVRMNLRVSKLPAGVHGLHIHENGACEAPHFQSAGAHYNPTNRDHGVDAPGGPHLGDLLNLEVNTQGEANIERRIDRVNVSEGAFSLLGRSLVVHQWPDNYQTQPAGDAGERIACGVIEPFSPAATRYPVVN